MIQSCDSDIIYRRNNECRSENSRTDGRGVGETNGRLATNRKVATIGTMRTNGKMDPIKKRGLAEQWKPLKKWRDLRNSGDLLKSRRRMDECGKLFSETTTEAENHYEVGTNGILGNRKNSCRPIE